jgi:oligopeptide/dipeptide ABC transporter ATP-binding protein
MSLLQVRGLTKRFETPRGLFRKPAVVQALSEVDLDVAPGETLAVVGESGCGKSTLGRAILRLHEPTAGTVRLDGEDVTAADAGRLRLLRRRMQIVFQDPFGSLNPRMTVAETLAEPMRLHRVAPEAEIPARVAELMETCGLGPHQAERYPHEFSGGQRQRVGVARALATRPDLVICDEPVSALDVSVQAQILNLLVDLQRRFGMAYLFISHDLAVVRHVARRVAVMYLGRIVEEAPAETLFASPRHPYTRSLMAAAPRPEPRLRARGTAERVAGDVPDPGRPPPGCAFHPRCPKAQAVCAARRPALEVSGDDARVACHFPEYAPAAALTAPPRAAAVARRLDVLARRRAADGAAATPS